MFEVWLDKKWDLDFVPSFATDLDLVQPTVLAHLTLHLQIGIVLAAYFSFINFVEISRWKVLGSTRYNVSVVRDHWCCIWLSTFIRFPTEFTSGPQSNLLHSFSQDGFSYRPLLVLLKLCGLDGPWRKNGSLISDILFQFSFYFFHIVHI